MELTVFLLSFSLIAIAELGDKTQLAVIMLTAKYRPLPILCGAMFAFLLVDGLGVLVGNILAEVLPFLWVGVGSGVAFICFGIYGFLSGEGEAKVRYGRFALLTSFILVSLMELGDKTQLATIVLAAKYAMPIVVLSGVMLAYLTITVVGVVVGVGLTKMVPTEKMRLIASLIFILFGVLFLFCVLTGIKLFG